MSVATPPVLRSDEPEGIRRSISSIGVIRFAGAQYGFCRRFANHIASVVPDGDLIRFYVDGQFVRTHVRLPTRGSAHGDPKLEVIYRNRKSSVPDVVGSASVKDQVDLICQA